MELLAACVAVTGLFALPYLTLAAPPAPPVVAPPALASLAAAKPRIIPILSKVRLPLTMLSGMASWYGTVFEGQKTASGEIFSQNALTACHRTLPFGTVVRVVDVNSGKSVIVRITDRGVLTPDRVIDLSAGAARQLGILSAGVARVRLEILGKEALHLTPPPPPAA